MAHVLSKSSYLRGWQCPKALWLWKHRNDLRPAVTPQLQAMFDQGTEVGRLAQKRFPGGVDCSPEKHFDYGPALAATQRALMEGVPAIYEAAFQHDGVLAALDILVRDGEGWMGVEVKSSTSSKDQFIEDCALQYHVLTNSGVTVTRMQLLVIDSTYVRNGPVEVGRLFKLIDLTDQVQARQEGVRERIVSLKNTLQGPEPEVPIGPQCDSPYSCDFKAYCWKDVPERSVFLLSRIGAGAFELHHAGVRKLEEVNDDVELTPVQRLQLGVELSGRPHIEEEPIRRFVAGLKYPLQHLDFETFALAVPPFNGTRPYQAIPFQFSLHVEAAANMEPEHRSFLADGSGDPREGFVRALLNAVGPEGDILVYNRSFEARILRELAEDKPHHATAIEGLLARLKDLAEPFAKRWYLTPGMDGRHSIKKVLPALVPELGYDDLEIGSGDLASLSFAQVVQGTYAGDETQLRRALEAYCALDTLAMVRVLRVLRRV